MKDKYTTASELLVDFFKTFGLKGLYVDKTFIISLDSERIIKIKLVKGANHEKFTGFNISIVNRKTGVIDSEFFPFAQWLTCEKPNYKVYVETFTDCFSDYFAWSFKPRPSSIMEMYDAMDDYISLFKIDK